MLDRAHKANLANRRVKDNQGSNRCLIDLSFFLYCHLEALPIL
jgi:hypothetical protein